MQKFDFSGHKPFLLTIGITTLKSSYSSKIIFMSSSSTPHIAEDHINMLFFIHKFILNNRMLRNLDFRFFPLQSFVVMAKKQKKQKHSLLLISWIKLKNL